LAKEARLLFAVFMIFASVIGGIGYLGYTGYKKFTAPAVKTYTYTTDQYVVISTDTIPCETLDGNPYYEEFFVLDINTRKAIDVKDQNDMEPSMFGYMVGREDYNRIHAGGMTDDEVALCKEFIDLTLHPEHENACCKTFDKDGNVIEHHHSSQGKTIPTPPDCV
jgi:hypothetical protein